MPNHILAGLLSMMLAVAATGCDQRENAAAQEVPAAPAASADQPAPASTEASAKIDEAVEATKVAAAKTGEAARATASEASDKARETAAEAYAKAGEAADLAGQAASDIAADLKRGASDVADSAKEAAGKAGDKLSAAADKAGDSAREAAAVAAEKAGEAADKAEQAMGSAADKARDFAEGLRSSDEAASPSAGASGLTLKFLAHQKFTLAKVNEADYHGEQRPFVEFGEQGLVSGKICNTFRGPGQLSDGVLTVEAMASTRMLCQVGGLDELETRFFDMLSKGAEISMDGSSLIFKQGGSAMVFEADTRL